MIVSLDLDDEEDVKQANEGMFTFLCSCGGENINLRD
jgi:hypothetical protein